MFRDHLLRCILPGPSLRLLVVHTTQVAKEAARLHGCEPTAAEVLAHALSGAALLGGLGKGDQRVTLQLEGRGPLGGLFAEGSADGGLRAFVRHPHVNFPGRDGSDLHMSLGAGGYLAVLRDLPGGEFYRGVVPLAPRLDLALETYFRSSEQVATAAAVAVRTGEGGIERAAAVLVQRLPEGDELAVRRVRERMRTGALTRALDAGLAGARIADELVADLGELELLEDVPLAHRCPCTRDRALRGVIAAGREEILDMVAREQGAELTCEFCRTPYRFEAGELLELVDRMGS